MLVKPSSAENHPWKMFFIGLVYASLSFLLVFWFFRSDPVLYKFSGILIVTLCVMFTLPFMYRLIRKEEKFDEDIEGLLHVWKVHRDAIFALMFLFLGFVVAFSFWHIVIPDGNLFNAQLETYCTINSPGNVEECVSRYLITGDVTSVTGSMTNGQRFLSILENNVYVMIFTLVFSLLFGAGAIFILAWNATVIAAAIGIFGQYELASIPFGLGRYMIHGTPEIAAYFITALAGGILGVGILRNGFQGKKFARVLENVIILLFVAILILILAAFVEVYVTPIIF